MTISTISIPRNVLRCAAVFTATEDIRYYLNGVYVEVQPRGVILVGTDGHRMGVLRVPNEDDAAPNEPATFIIPRDMTKAVKANKHVTRITLAYDSETRTIKLTDAGTSVTADAINGTFPDFRRVMPKATHLGKAAQFNTDYVASFGEAARVLGSKAEGVYIFHRGGSESKNKGQEPRPEAATVCILGHPEFFGVLMPMRSVSPECPEPKQWLAFPEPGKVEPTPEVQA